MSRAQPAPRAEAAPRAETVSRADAAPQAEAAPRAEHLDVLIVGAGLSGIAAGYRLQAGNPGKRYAILESRDAIGGTWDLFRYPGVRSDSDMYTLGYPFNPWRGEAIADGASIRDYVRATASRFGIDRHVRYCHRVVQADFCSAEARWTVQVERGGGLGDQPELIHLTCDFLLLCTGYYRYDDGYTPDFPGLDSFAGQVIHPQHWPDDLDYAGRRVVVIGSGATAITLVPALAERATHVTMLQRSPSYVVSLPQRMAGDSVVDRLPGSVAYRLRRWRGILLTLASFELSRRRPATARRLIAKAVASQLPPDVAVDPHFTPAYDPWDQRLCVTPRGELFKALRAGRVAIATDEIATFTERGLALASGAKLEADIVVTATGLELLALGGIGLAVDGREVKPGRTMAYRGMMLADVPNLAFAFGYTNASWTLKCDLVCRYVSRLLGYMDARGYRRCAPRRDATVEPLPLVGLTSGYIRRSGRGFPHQGAGDPWRNHQSYLRDLVAIKRALLDDGVLEFA